MCSVSVPCLYTLSLCLEAHLSERYQSAHITLSAGGPVPGFSGGAAGTACRRATP